MSKALVSRAKVSGVNVSRAEVPRAQVSGVTVSGVTVSRVRSSRTTRRNLSLAALPLAALALAGCGSGRHNQQYLEHSVVNGASSSLDGLSIRDAFITTPVARGGTATVTFGLYADTQAAATELVSVSSNELSGGVPAQLLTFHDGVSKVAGAVPIEYQSGPGANIGSAVFSDITKPALPAAYYDVTFTFANQLTQTLQVPVQQVGAVDPLSTAVPTSIPEIPFPLRTTLPGEGVASSAP